MKDKMIDELEATIQQAAQETVHCPESPQATIPSPYRDYCKCSKCGAPATPLVYLFCEANPNGIPVGAVPAGTVPNRWQWSYYCPKCHPELPKNVREWKHRTAIVAERSSLASQKRAYRQQARDAFDESIGRRYASCRFSSFRPQNESQTLALDQVQKWVENPGARERYPFLVLHGAPGLGKTHLAVAAWRRLVRIAEIPMFANESRLSHAWRASHKAYERSVYRYQGLTPTETIEEAADAGILIIDDLGKTALSDGWGNALYTIIERRDADCRPTLVTTNYQPSELAARIQAWTADRVLSGLVIRLEGTSMRMAI